VPTEYCDVHKGSVFAALGRLLARLVGGR
jgi:hypothetical protein